MACKNCGYEEFKHPDATTSVLTATEMNAIIAAIRPMVFSIVIEAMRNVYRTHVAALESYGPKEDQ